MKKFKYECRPCPPHIRAQCIREASLSPAVKRIIAQAFDSRTDTEDTWDMLQSNCFLMRMDQVPVVAPTGMGPRKGGLWERLHSKEESSSTEKPEIPTVKPRTGQFAGSVDVEHQAGMHEIESPQVDRPAANAPDASQSAVPTGAFPSWPSAEPVAPPEPPVRERLVPSSTQTSASTGLSAPTRPAVLQELAYPEVIPPRFVDEQMVGPYILVSLANGHRILLPEEGELVLGRFDPLTGVRPDIDLSFEDRSTMAISRRHARLLGWHGQCAIEDLGSSNGTWINNKRLDTGQQRLLKIGDVVRLGRCILFVNQPPEIWQRFLPNGRYFFYATFSGRFFPLNSQGESLVGRADPDLGFHPDVDLGQEPGTEMVVSRRHAKLIAQHGQFTVQDLGSTYGTRLDGQDIPVGEQASIKPGQHLWLGGYTLAFDVI